MVCFFYFHYIFITIMFNHVQSIKLYLDLLKGVKCGKAVKINCDKLTENRI